MKRHNSAHLCPDQPRIASTTKLKSQRSTGFVAKILQVPPPLDMVDGAFEDVHKYQIAHLAFAYPASDASVFVFVQKHERRGERSEMMR